MVRGARWLAALGSALALGGLSMLAGCGQSGAARSARLPAGRTFVSTSGTDGGHQRPLVRATKISLTFQAGNISPNAGCNTISGGAAPDAGPPLVGALARTPMAGPHPLANQHPRPLLFP